MFASQVRMADTKKLDSAGWADRPSDGSSKQRGHGQGLRRRFQIAWTRRSPAVGPTLPAREAVRDRRFDE